MRPNSRRLNGWLASCENSPSRVQPGGVNLGGGGPPGSLVQWGRDGKKTRSTQPEAKSGPEEIRSSRESRHVEEGQAAAGVATRELGPPLAPLAREHLQGPRSSPRQAFAFAPRTSRPRKRSAASCASSAGSSSQRRKRTARRQGRRKEGRRTAEPGKRSEAHTTPRATTVAALPSIVAAAEKVLKRKWMP